MNLFKVQCHYMISVDSNNTIKQTELQNCNQNQKQDEEVTGYLNFTWLHKTVTSIADEMRDMIRN